MRGLLKRSINRFHAPDSASAEASLASRAVGQSILTAPWAVWRAPRHHGPQYRRDQDAQSILNSLDFFVVISAYDARDLGGANRTEGRILAHELAAGALVVARVQVGELGVAVILLTDEPALLVEAARATYRTMGC
jgi:hypothetical protein